MSSKQGDRPTKRFYALIGNDVKAVTGYQCIPANPECWWLPEAGYSQHQDYLYTNPEAALDAAIAETEKFERGIQEKLSALRAQKEAA